MWKGDGTHFNKASRYGEARGLTLINHPNGENRGGFTLIKKK